MFYLKIRIASQLAIQLTERLITVISTTLLVITFLGSISQAQQCQRYLNPQISINLLTNAYSEVVNPTFIQQGSWASSLADLAVSGRLISQTDPKLDAMNLLADGGGVCGPTCISYIAASQDFHSSKKRSTYWVDNLHIFIDGLLRNYQEIALAQNHSTGLDPRMGTILDFFTSNLNPRINELGVNARMVNETDIVNLEKSLRNQDGILIGVAQLIKRRSTGYVAHAIIILSINTSDKLLVILDPNNPSKLLITNYTVYNDKIYFALDETVWGDSGTNQVYLSDATLFTIK